MGARILDGVTVAVHYVVMAYIVFGGFLAWRWRWTIGVHSVAICWAAITLLLPVNCPLTTLEDYFRQQGSLPPLHGGFIATYLTGVLYPAAYLPLVQVLAGTTALVSWAGLYLRQVRRRNAPVDHLKLG